MRIAGIILGIIGIVFAGLGGYLLVKERLFLQTAESATAVVTDNKRYTYTGQVNEYGVQHYYCSEFEFQTKGGGSVSFEEPKCAELDSPPDYQVGQKVDVYYDPQDPTNSVQVGKPDYSGAIAATAAGAFFALLGLGLSLVGWLRGGRTVKARA